jgi:hypothetical protein
VQTLATRRHRLEASTRRLSVSADTSGSIGPPMTTSVSSTVVSSDTASVTIPRLFHHGPLISRKDQEPIGGTFELAIRRFERPGRTGEVEHLKPWGNVETDSGHGRIIGKFDLSVIYRPL